MVDEQSLTTDDAERTARTLLTELVTEDLIVVDGTLGAPDRAPARPIELRRFTDLQDGCDANPAILSFIEAQDVLRGIAEVVTSFVGKSLERGHVPTEAEIFSKGWGEGCGYH